VTLPLLAWLKRTLIDPDLPSVVVEVRGRALGVVRLVREGRGYAVGAAACLELPEGVLNLSMTQPNVTDVPAFQQVLRSLLERAGGLEVERIGLVLPDPVARVALLPAAEMKPQGRMSLDEMLRFRLRKVVPFEIRDACLASTAGGVAGAASLLAVAIAQPVLESYEEPCRALGLEPALVEISGLTLLGPAAQNASGDRLLVNWDDSYVSFLLTRGGWPILIRTLSGAAADLENIKREADQTLLYYRERLAGAGLEALLVRAGGPPFAEAAALLRDCLAIEPQLLDPWGKLKVGPAEVAQALAGAAAAVARKAA
jgi:hypothetical protein